MDESDSLAVGVKYSKPEDYLQKEKEHDEDRQDLHWSERRLGDEPYDHGGDGEDEQNEARDDVHLLGDEAECEEPTEISCRRSTAPVTRKRIRPVFIAVPRSSSPSDIPRRQ
jgi:hypothetical protein